MIDESRSDPYAPYYPYDGPKPVTPGEVYEYRIGIQPISHELALGHSLEFDVRAIEI